MKTIFKFVFGVACIALLGYAIYYLTFLIVYILIAGILSLLGRPIMDRLENLKIGQFGIPRSLCAVLTILTFYLAIAGFIALFAPLIVEQIKVIAGIDFGSVKISFEERIKDWEQYLTQIQLVPDNKGIIDSGIEQIVSFFNLNNLSNFFNTFLGVLGNTFAALFSISFITYFFLTDRVLMYDLILNFVPPKLEKSFDHVVVSTKELLTRYFTGVFLQVSIIATVVTIGLLILGIENALLIGFFAGVMNIIPYIGPLFGAAFGLFIAVTSGIEANFYAEVIPIVIKVASIFGIAQVLDSVILQPTIFSNSINAHPLEIFFLIWIAGTFAGISGMILAIPCYTIIRVVTKELFLEFGLIRR